MSRKHRSAIAEKKPELETAPSAVSGNPPKSFPWLTAGVFALLFVSGFLVLNFWQRDPAGDPPGGTPEPELASWVESEEWALLRRFAELKAANDPKFRDLLGAEPWIPDGPIGAPEAAALQTALYLRQPFEIEKIRPQTRVTNGPKAQFVLVIQGTVNSPALQVKNGAAVDVVKRVMYNPDIIVRVEDGKVVGVKAQMRGEGNQQPLTREQEQRMKQALGAR